MEHGSRLRLDRPASVSVVFCVDVHSPIETFISGVGFGTADSTGYSTLRSYETCLSLHTPSVFDEDQMAADFVSTHRSRTSLSDCAQFGFLDNLVKVFPGLAKRPLHLTGESYAGMYIVSVLSCCMCRTNIIRNSLTLQKLTSRWRIRQLHCLR
jgi:hypothetical protein